MTWTVEIRVAKFYWNASNWEYIQARGESSCRQNTDKVMFGGLNVY